MSKFRDKTKGWKTLNIWRVRAFNEEPLLVAGGSIADVAMIWPEAESVTQLNSAALLLVATCDESVSLSHDELVAACANVGVDLSCGACAAIFYTSVALVAHTCGRRVSDPIVGYVE